MFTAAMAAVLVSLVLAVWRALAGPTVFDRLLAANAVGTGTIIVLALSGFLTERPDFLDIGILYALLNMIGTLAVLKFFRYGGLGYRGEDEEPEA